MQSISYAELTTLMSTLSSKRTIFHSERDYQLATAWELKLQGCDVRLEYKPNCFETKTFIDILVLKPKRIAIELKYKTSPLNIACNDEQFNLTEHSAGNQGRYDFWKDVARLERLVKSGDVPTGYALLLTNDARYWTGEPGGYEDDAFRLNDGREIIGNLAWTKPHTKLERQQSSVDLSGVYRLIWREYSTCDAHRNHKFRYLLLQVGNKF